MAGDELGNMYPFVAPPANLILCPWIEAAKGRRGRDSSVAAEANVVCCRRSSYCSSGNGRSPRFCYSPCGSWVSTMTPRQDKDHGGTGESVPIERAHRFEGERESRSML